MDNIINLLDKIIVDGQEIDLQSLALINGTLNVGHQKDVIVEYIFKDETQIPSDIFKNLKQLKYAYFPKAGNIKTIGERAFANSNLSYINSLSSVNYIGAQAFSYTKLTYVYNGDSPDSIAANAWSYIGTLTDDFKTILKRKYPYIDFGAEKENEGYDPWEIYDETPIINVTSNIINATSNGGEYEIEYTITNPLVGITISAISNVDWITNFNYNTSSKIKFTINPQEANSQQRSGNITLSYGNASKTITVIQAASGEVIIKQDVTLSYNNPIVNITGNVGDEITLQEVNCSYPNAQVTFTVQSAGVITENNGRYYIANEGQATVIANYAGDDTHNPATAQYTINITIAN